MFGVFRISLVLSLLLCCNLPSFAVASGSGVNVAVLDKLERLRFGHTNRDIRIKERVNVLEWSVLGGRQPGSLSERLANVEQRLDSEGQAACINTVGMTYDPARPRTGYLVAGRYYRYYRVHKGTRNKGRSKSVVVAQQVPKARTVSSKAAVATVSPEQVTGLIKKGNDLYMSGNYRKSVQELTRAIQLDPSYAPAYVCRGYAYGKLGRADMEKSDFRLAKKLDSRIQLPM